MCPRASPWVPAAATTWRRRSDSASRPAMSPSRSARRVSCTQRRRHRRPIRRAMRRFRRRHGRLPAARVHPQRHQGHRHGRGWLGMDHETFAAAALDAPAGAMVSGSPPISTESGHPTCSMRRARSKGFATTRRPRISPEPPMKVCFAACSSDVRPWPPQEQRSMGECT